MDKKQNERILSKPAAEFAIDLSLVKNLVYSQFENLHHLPITKAGSGWDNEMFNIGDDLQARLPRRSKAMNLLDNELQWLPEISPLLNIPTSTPSYVGKPDFNYPSKWTIVPYFKGSHACDVAIHKSETLTLSTFLHSLHSVVPENAPTNLNRSSGLKKRSNEIYERLESLELKTSLITQNIKSGLATAIEAAVPKNKCLIHGDLHPGNIIINDSKIAAVIDWGDLCAGDCATDLAIVWMLDWNQDCRHEVLALYKANNQTIIRAMGWAIFFGLVLLETGMNSNKEHAIVGERTLLQLNSDIGSIIFK